MIAMEEPRQTCTPVRVDGDLVGCGECAACHDQEDAEQLAEEEYGA